MPVASRAMRSRFQRSGQAATDGQVWIDAHGVAQGRLEDALRGVGTEALGAHGPEVAVDLRDEFSQIVQAPSGPADHLLEDGLPEFLVVIRESVLHLRLDRGRTEVADSFEEGVEEGDVEVDHFAQRPRVVREVDVEAQVGRPQTVLERPRIVLPPFDEAELREPLQELRRGRDVDVQGTSDLAREVPIRVPEGPQDREAVLAREEHDGPLERLLVHGGNLHRNGAARTELYASWSGEFISCPPGFSRLSIVGQNEQLQETRVTHRSRIRVALRAAYASARAGIVEGDGAKQG